MADPLRVVILKPSKYTADGYVEHFSVGMTAMSLFNRYCAWRRIHAMSGGVVRVWRDRVDDYLALRKGVFGFELVPLPRSLQLSAAESLLNRVINPHVRASLPRASRPSTHQ